jgi:hypothetical protein
MVVGPVLLVGLDLGLEGVLVSLLPLGWADLTVLVDILESLDESQDFVNVSSDWKIIVGSVSQDSLSVNDESSSIFIRIIQKIKFQIPSKKIIRESK